MNNIAIVGNLTKDPESSATASGISVCRFTVAVGRNYKNSDGEREADFLNVVTWRGLADNCSTYLSKGKKVAVTGSLQMRSYEDKDGNKRTAYEIVAETVEFLSPKDAEDNASSVPKAKNTQHKMELVDDLDLPF